MANSYFEPDDQGDAMPVLGRANDSYWELDPNGDVEPKSI